MKNNLFAKTIIVSGLIPIVLLTFTTIFYSENILFKNLLFFYYPQLLSLTLLRFRDFVILRQVKIEEIKKGRAAFF